MKSKTKDFDHLQIILKNTREIVESRKKTYDDSIKWLKNAKKQLKKIQDCTKTLSSQNDGNMHPYFKENTFQTFSKLSEVIKSFVEFLEQKIPNARVPLNTIDDEISSIKEKLGSYINNLDSAHVELYSMIAYSSKSQEYLKYGFDLHHTYLRYFYQLTDIQKQIIDSIKDIKKIIDRISEEEKRLINELNSKAETFPIKDDVKKRLEEGFKKNTENDDFDLDKTINEINMNFDEYREPHFNLSDEYKFENPRVEMEVISDFSRETDEQINIKQGEIVTVIDSALPTYWKIKTASGIEGDVPSICLAPKQKQS